MSPSSKNKSKWRKIDIKDLEEYYGEKNMYERSGGDLSKLKDSEIFHVSKKIIMKDRGKKLKKDFSSHLDNIYTSFSSVSPIKISRNENYNKSINRGYLSSEEEEIDKRSIEYKKNFKPVFITGLSNMDYNIDSWAEFKKSKDKAVNYLPSLKQSLPTSGLSYNPAFNVYKKLLDKALLLEGKKIKRERNISKKLKKIKSVNLLELSIHEKKQIISGLPEQFIKNVGLDYLVDSNNKTNGDDFIEDNCFHLEDYGNILLKKMIPDSDKRKTKRQKNRTMRHKLLIQNQKFKDINKKILKDLNNIGQILTQVKKEKEKEERKRIMLKKSRKLRNVCKTKNEEIDDVQLPEDLCKSLISLKPLNNLMKSKFQKLAQTKMFKTGTYTKSTKKVRYVNLVKGLL